jgi:hypothetical protein
MKRLLLGMMVVGGAALLGGCPIYPDNNSYVQCQTAYDCGPGYACASRGECVPSAPYYADDASPSGECGFCPTGTVCTLANQTLQCLPPLLPETDASIDIRDASSSFDASLFDAAFTLDATPEDGGFVAEAGGGATCNSDAQCATTVGAKCIDGLCAAQSQLCSDGTQCLVAGDSCVDGTCVPPCSHAAPFCPTGYQCDFNRSACSVNPGVCASTGDCQGGAVCVDTHCVAPCSSADAGSQCVAGQVCVNGGCIPDQQARFACRNDGNQGSLANSCDPDSVCLHGDCYPGCDAEGGGCAATGESCKAVTIAKGTFAVCGANANLGSDCDPAVGRYCVSPKACVNGYCL